MLFTVLFMTKEKYMENSLNIKVSTASLLKYACVILLNTFLIRLLRVSH